MEIDKRYELLLNKIKNGSISQINKAFATMINDLTVILSNEFIQDPRINKKLQEKIIRLKRDFVNTYNEILKNYEFSAIELSQRKNIVQINNAIMGLEVKSGLVKNWLGRPNKPNVKSVSKSVWNINKGFYGNLDSVLKSGLLEGQSAHEIKLQLTRLLNNPHALDISEITELYEQGKISSSKYYSLKKKTELYKPGQGVYKSAKKNAFRLARTEVNRSYRQQDHDIRKRLPFVIGQEVKLSDSHPKLDICDSAIGIYPKDYLFLGWHSGCICYVIPILATKNQTAKLIANKPVKLRQINNIPKRMEKYIKSKKKNIKNYKTKPYFLQENSKYFDKLLK